MIWKLNHGLTIEFLLVAVFIGLAFRSVVVMLSASRPASSRSHGHGAVDLGEGGVPPAWSLTVSFAWD
jgi:hypothetical protein